jgi:peptidoglycan/LPS O-acetylase OafA/YrhL
MAMTETAAMKPAAPDAPLPAARPARGRLFYLDNLRIVLTVLVVLHHLGVTYGHIPVWYYHENPPAGDAASSLLDLFVATNQMFFMGFFFLISGYFVPASYDRKGGKTFLKDRAIRLGIPLLAFLLILRPADQLRFVRADTRAVRNLVLHVLSVQLGSGSTLVRRNAAGLRVGLRPGAPRSP